MIETDREICVCNSVTMLELAECIRQHGMASMEALLQNQTCPVGDKCEACIEDGYDNDGYSLAMVLALVKQGRI